MSEISFKNQSESALEKLRDALDMNFEYIGHEITTKDFKYMIVEWMKNARSRLKKGKALKPTKPPPHIQSVQWEALEQYWEKTETQQKSGQMSEARKKVKNNPLVGRRGYKGKEEMERKVTDRLLALERSRKLYTEQLDTVVKSTVANAAGILDLQKMFKKFMRGIRKQSEPGDNGIHMYYSDVEGGYSQEKESGPPHRGTNQKTRDTLQEEVEKIRVEEQPSVHETKENKRT